MIVSHIDARRMMCPVLAVARSIERPPTCRAMQCMAWRDLRDGRGYCGLAGLPPELAIEATLERHRAAAS